MALVAHTLYKLFVKEIEYFRDMKAKIIHHDLIRNYSRFGNQ